MFLSFEVILKCIRTAESFITTLTILIDISFFLTIF